jgi:hypothetical protein
VDEIRLAEMPIMAQASAIVPQFVVIAKKVLAHHSFSSFAEEGKSQQAEARDHLKVTQRRPLRNRNFFPE